MQVILESSFLKAAQKLPSEVKKKLTVAIGMLADDPFHPLLHTKRLKGELAHFFSFRVTREWRVIFIFEKPEIVRVLDVGHRKDIYR